MAREFNRKLILETGKSYLGYGFGSDRDRVCDIAFNTAMAGYQEIVSDLAATDTAIVMTYPLIGNYGITDEDFETRFPTIGGLIVMEYNDLPSNFRSTKTLAEILEDFGIPGIEGVDTRALTRYIRDNGSCRCLITGIDTSDEEGMRIIHDATVRHDAVSRVSCRKKWYSRTPAHKYNVVALDLGIKLGVIRSLNALSCNMTIVPWNTSAADIMALRPDGVLISNGPGSPEDIPAVEETVKALAGKVPMMGICLGHSMIARAYGAKTVKMSVGHHGGNHPVKNLETGKVEFTAQGHVYAVDEASLSGTRLTVTHKNILDGTVEGVACKEDKVFAVQHHPESAPGPQDSSYLFEQFITMMAEEKKHA